MNGVAVYEDRLSERIKGLPMDKVKEVIDYVDFLKWREIKDSEFDRFDEMTDTWRQRFGKVAKSIQQDAVAKQLDKLSEEEITQFIKELRLERTKR